MNMDMEVTVYNFDLNRDDNDDDSNASDEIFKHDNKYQKESDNELKRREQGLTTNETQDEHFQNPIQQHNPSNTKPNTKNNDSVSTSSSNSEVNKEDVTSNSGVLHNHSNNDEHNNSTLNSGVDGKDNNILYSGVGG